VIWIGIVLLAIYVLTVTFFCVKFALILIRVQESVEVCLDAINEKYSKMTEIASRPLFIDSPEVRSVIKEIKDVRLVLHGIAYSLSSEFESLDIDEEKEED